MNSQKTVNPSGLIFSRWSRKGYAVFASLGKVVKIGRIAVDICRVAILKTSALKEGSARLLTNIVRDSKDDEDIDFTELISQLLMLQLLPVETESVSHPEQKYIFIHHNRGVCLSDIYPGRHLFFYIYHEDKTH